MNNKIFIPQAPANSKPLDLKRELEELRSILDKIEKQVSGQPINETCRKLIKNAMERASGNLGAALSYKKFSDQDKRR